jgi:hypothetical protein
MTDSADSGTPQTFDWTPIPAERMLFIARPAMVHEFRPIDVAAHRCTLEYRRVDDVVLRREVEILHVRQISRSVIVAARTLGAGADEIPEYRVHRIVAITGRDGVRMPPIDYLRRHLGIDIE